MLVVAIVGDDDSSSLGSYDHISHCGTQDEDGHVVSTPRCFSPGVRLWPCHVLQNMFVQGAKWFLTMGAIERGCAKKHRAINEIRAEGFGSLLSKRRKISKDREFIAFMQSMIVYIWVSTPTYGR